MCVVMRVNLFGNIAALHQHRHFLKHPLPIELRARRRQQPLRQPLLVALLNLRPQLGHAVGCLRKPVERSMQNRRQRLAFARAHRLQLFQQRPDLLLHAFRNRRQIAVCPALGLQRARHAQHRIQIRLALNANLPARRIKRRKIACHQLAIVARAFCWLARSTSNVNSTCPRTRLSFITLRSSISSASRPGGQPQLQIEKAVIHALHGERVAQLVLARAAGTRTWTRANPVIE